MPILKNGRHEKFAEALFKGVYQRDIYIELYHPSYSMATIDANASRLASNEKIVARIKELHEATASETIMSVKERKERLSEIARAKLGDFIQVNEDGSIKKIDIRAVNDAALQEVTVTEFAGGKDQRAKERSTRLRLHNPMTAIDLLNKMEGEYPPSNILKLEAGDTLAPVLTELLARLRGYGASEHIASPQGKN